jgi:phosphodiester glycosidase
MSTHPLARRRLRAAERLTRRRAPLARLRTRLQDGALTTLHVASYDRTAFRPGIVALERPQQLAAWCVEHGVRHAIVGGFFLRPEYRPLGELRLDGVRQPSVAVHSPWAERRACLAVDGETVRIARRDDLPAEVAGDLLQAGPLLVRDGRLALGDGEDVEGFSAGSDQFDSDITQGRYPRAALGLTPTRLLAVACDGRTETDAGMTLSELAAALVELGVTDALNLDGGGSSSLVHNGRLRNRPREEHGVDLLGGRPIVTAIVFENR